ncbi:hypothetical protein [Glaciimonas sp. PCH181]|nr:hypothetical protein [Glaciimonas sp. PCH181]
MKIAANDYDCLNVSAAADGCNQRVTVVTVVFFNLKKLEINHEVD